MPTTRPVTPPTERSDASTLRGDIGRGAFVFSRSGARGLLLWLFRREIADGLARHLTAKAAAIAFIACLVTYAAANNLGAEHRRNILRASAYSVTPTGELSWEYQGLMGARQGAAASRAYRLREYSSDSQRRSRVRTPATSYVSFADYVLARTFAILSFLCGWSLLAIPMLAVLASLVRTQREAMAYEHGEGTPEYEAAIRAATRKGEATMIQDDWLVDPPWRRKEAASKNDRPRFGRRPTEARN